MRAKSGLCLSNDLETVVSTLEGNLSYRCEV